MLSLIVMLFGTLAFGALIGICLAAIFDKAAAIFDKADDDNFLP